MVLKKDMSGVPDKPERLPVPVVEAAPEGDRIAPYLVRGWFQKWSSRDDFVKPMSVEGRMYRASWAFMRCQRQLWYAMNKEEETNPPTVADYWRMAAGTLVHTLLQDEDNARHAIRMLTGCVDPDVEFEKAVDLTPLGLNGSATADIYWNAGDSSEVVEMKSIGGYPFKKMTQRFKGGPDGPKDEHVIQGAMSAAALGANLRILYASLELVGASLTERMGLDESQRFSAEYVFLKEEVDEIARQEVERVNSVMHEVMVPMPYLRDKEVAGPDEDAMVTDPRTGAVVVTGADGRVRYSETWRCAYCRWKDQCIEDGVD